MGCCCNDTHSLIWIYRQLYFIICIYIRGIKSSGMLGMVSVEMTPSVYIDFSWQLYFIVCIYIRGIKSSGLRMMVYFESTPSACIELGWQLYFIVCIYIRGIKSSYTKWMGWWCGRSFLLFTAKLFSICADEVGTNHPIFSFSTVPVFVIGCSTMAHPASCQRGSPVRRGQLRDILRRVPASCPACHFPEIWYWGSIWWCRDQNRCAWSRSVG